MYLLLSLAAAAGVLWLWKGDRDPLMYLVPPALAFPPLLAYAGEALDWPTRGFSTRIALAGCICLACSFRFLRGDFHYLPIRGTRFVVPYLAAVVLSVLWSALGPYNGDVGAIANEFLTWLLPVAVFLMLAVSRRSPLDSARAARVLMATTLGIALYSIWQALALLGYDSAVPRPVLELTVFGERDLWWAASRLYGTLPNLGPNVMGVFLTVPVLILFAGAVIRRGLPRLEWAVGAVAGASVIVGTFSRGALLGLVVGVVAIPVLRRNIRATAWTLAVGGALLGTIAETPVGRGISSIYSEGQLDRDATARVYLWKAIWQDLPQHPFGRGFNGWLRASRTATGVGLADQPSAIGAPHPAENQWMREIADRGVLGAIALAGLVLGLIGTCFKGAATTPRESDRIFLVGAGAAFAAWSVAMLTGDQLAYESSAGMFWYTAGLSLSLVNSVPEPAAIRDAARAPSRPIVTDS
jgi:O-antigen ligase/polysaccharide polymerase Wzy-like membrane protein